MLQREQQYACKEQRYTAGENRIGLCAGAFVFAVNDAPYIAPNMVAVTHYGSYNNTDDGSRNSLQHIAAKMAASSTAAGYTSLSV